MFSAEGLPDVGSSLTVQIKTVILSPDNAFVEFGGNLNNGQDTEELHKQITKEVGGAKTTQRYSDGRPGDLCLFIDNDVSHRARILSKSDHQYKVFLIDDGEVLWAPSKVFTKCPKNLQRWPPIVELCVLANASPLSLTSSWSASASNFIRSVCGDAVPAVIQDVVMPHRIVFLDIPSMSQQMYELGFARKVSSENFKSLVTSALNLPRARPDARPDLDISNGKQEPDRRDPGELLQYFQPELLSGTIEVVTVTQVIHPMKFFCRLLAFSQELQKLSEHLQEHYEAANLSQTQAALRDGLPCASRGSDGKWYRSLLQQNTLSDIVKVFHVDYGIGDFVKPCNIRPLAAKFFRLPLVTYACHLKGVDDKDIGWRTDQIDYLKSLLDNQVLVAQFEHDHKCESVSCVTLYGKDGLNVNHAFARRDNGSSVTDNYCVDQTLVTLNKVMSKHLRDCDLPAHSSKTTRSEDIVCGSSRVEKLPQTDGEDALVVSDPGIEVGSKTKVLITCVQSVTRFYGHLHKNLATLEQMTKDIQQLCRNGPQTTSSVRPKMMCLAKYVDGQWHRARIESTSPRTLVHFVDYGDQLVLDKSDIRPFPHKSSGIAAIPIQVVQFELFDASLPGSEDLNSWFSNYTLDRMFTVTVKKISEGKVSVEMYDKNTNLNLMIKDQWNKTKRKGFSAQAAVQIRSRHVPVGGKESQRGTGENNSTQKASVVSRQVQKPEQHAFENDLHSLPTNSTKAVDFKARPELSGLKKDRPRRAISCYPKLSNLPVRVLEASSVSEVYVSHCNSPSSFFVQLASEEENICALLNELNSAQLGDAQVEPSLLEPGDVVKAEYPADGSWYRAVVLNKDGKKITVQFIDFGNEATLIVLQIRQLGKQFLNMPRQSIHCKLDHPGRDWSEEEIVAFKKAAGENGEKTITCKFSREEASSWLVSLEDQGRELVGPLFTLEAAPQTKAQMPSSDDVRGLAFKEPSVTEGQIVEAYASSIVGPSYFWCQFKDTEELDRISLIVQEHGNSLEAKAVQPVQLCQGFPCLARFSDQLWYRSQVVRSFADTVSVLFIDYGNESDVELNSVRILPCSLLEAPPQAFLCQLESANTLSDSSNDKFFELVVDEPLKVTIQNKEMSPDLKNCPQHRVLVECKGLVVNEIMKEDWWNPNPQASSENHQETHQHLKPTSDAQVVNHESHQDSGADFTVTLPCQLSTCLPQAKDLLPCGVKPGLVSRVHISHVNSFTNFFVQLADEKNKLFSLTELLNPTQSSEKSEIQISNLTPGSLVKALFPEHNSWYRAAVKGTTEDKSILVEFIDFGNEAAVFPCNITRLDQQLLSFPRFSLRCCHCLDLLKLCQGLKEEEELLLFKLKFGEVSEKSHSCQFIKEENGTWLVEMTSSSSALDSLSGTNGCLERDSLQTPKAIEQPLTEVVDSPVNEMFTQHFHNPELVLGETVEAFASSIVDPTFFWCQFDNSEELEQISRTAQEYGNSSETKPMDVKDSDLGSPCLARFSEDQLWYRAQVLEKSSNSLRVVFVDYGNESDIDQSSSSCKAIPAAMLLNPTQAFLCRLAGFRPSEGTWTSDAADHFYHFLVNKALRVSIQSIGHGEDSHSPLYSVTVETEQSVVNELMKKYWMCVPHDASVTEPCEENGDDLSEINASDAHEGADVFVAHSQVPNSSTKTDSEANCQELDSDASAEQSRTEENGGSDKDLPSSVKQSGDWVPALENQMQLVNLSHHREMVFGTEDSCGSLKCVYK